MTPLKDTIDAPQHAGEGALAPGSDPSKQAQGLRSDAVSLDVPVKVHGSRVTDVVRGITSHTEPFEEETATMIVFPQGGVLKMSTPVATGQMVVLTNMKSGHDAICRIVKVRAYAQNQSYVEIEFTNRQPGYWGVLFTADAAEAQQQKTARPATSAPPVTNVSTMPAPVVPVTTNVAPQAAVDASAPVVRKPEVEKVVPAPKPAPPVVASVSSTPGVPGERTSQPAKPGSPFVGIGAQEKVQPPASDTQNNKANRSAMLSASSLPMSELRGDGPPAPSASSMSSFGSGVPGEVLELPLDDLETESEAIGKSAASVVAASVSPGQDTSQPAFGARFDSGAMSGSTQESTVQGGSSKKLYIGLGVAAALVLAAAGPLYFHAWPFGPASPASVSATGVPAAPAIDASSPRNPDPHSAAPANPSNPAMTAKASTSAPQAQSANASKASKTAAVEPLEQPQPTAPVSDKPAKEVPNMFGVLNAHPSASASSRQTVAVAPSLDPGLASGTESAALESGPSGFAAPLTPRAGSSSPIPVPLGGEVKPPRLLHSVAPVYPSVARASGVEGKVVIDTSIDKGGNVTVVKIVSGPLLLRQAALEALSHWKYQPATLNGDPVVVQFTVVIDFHH